MTLRISVGTTSVIKLEAVREALARIKIEAEVIPVLVSSGVPEQPVGGEAVKGALNRARWAQGAVPGTWSIGIENGLVDAGFAWLDRGYICLISPSGVERMAETPDTFLYAVDVEEARRRGFHVTTIGRVMSERTGCDPADPHAYLNGNRSHGRKSLLREALVPLLQESLFETHRVSLAGRVLDLPIVPVTAAVSVALFNLLGDWDLTEHVGARLQSRLPVDVDALVMPDGKAQALLHVMGRIARLPTFVARKELKPYMRDVVSAEATSITSGRRQALHLDGRDAESLRGKRVAIVDDVVSTGSTLDAMADLVGKVGAVHVATMAVFTEGDSPRDDVISLGHLPLFRRA